MAPLGLVFDFDGVILDSIALKRRAFASIFSEHTALLDRIIDYNANQPGVPRQVKVRFVCEQILQVDNIETAVAIYLHRYAEALKITAANACLIAGVQAFLEQTDASKFVCSSAPQEEVVELATKHQIAHHFLHIYGYPYRKAEILQELKGKYQRLVFFGDAMADYEAACLAGVGFIGVVNAQGEDRFKGLSLPKIQGFDDIVDIRSLLRSIVAN